MGSTYVEKLEDTQRDLATYFDKSAATVRYNFDRFEKEYGRPAIKYSLASFNAYPFTSTFIAIFSLLSFLPVVFFLGFSLFVITSIIFAASALSMLAIAAVEAIFATILLTTLTGLLCLTTFLTPFAISTYLAFRFIIHVRSGGRAGASEWATETVKHFVRSDKSDVLVDGKEDHSRGEFMENQGGM